MSPNPPPGPLSPLRPAQGQGVVGSSGSHPLVDLLVDRVRALIEGAFEEQGAHGDGEGEGGSPAEQRRVQLRGDRRPRHDSPMQDSLLPACTGAAPALPGNLAVRCIMGIVVLLTLE